MIVLKISDEQGRELGVDNSAGLLELAKRAKETKAALESMSEENESMSATLEDLAKRLDAIEAALNERKPDAVLTEEHVANLRTELLASAVAEATKTFMAHTARVGSQALPANEGVDVSTGKAQLDPNDFAGQWRASAELRDEFPSEQAYAAYRRATADGRARIMKRQAA